MTSVVPTARHSRLMGDPNKAHMATATATNIAPGRNGKPAKDDSIIRGAAIIRQQIQRQLGQETTTAYDQSLDTSFLSQQLDQLRYEEQLSDTDDDDNFSDPWAKPDPHHESPVEVRNKGMSSKSYSTPETVDLDEDNTFFGSVHQTDTFSSLGDQWAHNVFQSDPDASTMGWQSTASPGALPDMDPSDPLTPQHAKTTRKQLGTAKLTTYLVGPIATQDEDTEMGNSSAFGGSYDFIEQDYAEEFDFDDYDQVVNSTYLPRDLQAENDALLNKSGRKSRRKPQKGQGKMRKARILQLVTNEPETATTSSPESAGQLPTPTRTKKGRPQKSPKPQTPVVPEVPSLISVEHNMLMQDPAYRHAQRAGHLWQSLVGSQIRFPSSWWNGARAPPLGLLDKASEWQYYGRYTCYHPALRKYVKHRSAPGRILLHLIVQDLVTWRPVQDVVVGCFDPNARGIRQTVYATAGQEDRRELWLAVRKRSDENGSAVDAILAKGRTWSESLLSNAKNGPLGPDHRITNINVRAVFGEEAPVETVFCHESTLYERLVAGQDQGAPIFLVREFVL